MRINALQCAHCSAPLDIPADVNVGKCEYCGSSHLISVQSGARSDRNPPVNALERELQKLDAEWEQYRAQYLSKRADGTYDIPAADDWRYQKVGVAVFVVVAIMASVAIGVIFDVAVFRVQLIGLIAQLIVMVAVIAGVLLVVCYRRHKLARVYARSLENYRRQRHRILQAVAEGRT